MTYDVCFLLQVSLYRIIDEATLYNPDGRIGAGAQLIQRQQVSAYSAEWVIFKGNLKDVVKDWIRNPATNKGKHHLFCSLVQL